MLCEYCKITSGVCTVCSLTGKACIFVRYCPTQRELVMNDLYKKTGCVIKKRNRNKEKEK